MISIQQNEKPDLPLCQMNCDSGLHKKLNKYVLSSFLNAHSTNLFIGWPGSGKTSLLYSFFKSKELFNKVFHNVFLFQPSHSRASMKDKMFNKLPQEQIFDELDYESLNSVMETIKNEDSKFNHCIIFDDMTAYLKNNDTLKLFTELVNNRRHLHTSIFFLVQTYHSIPKEIRRVFSNVFVFRVAKDDLASIFEELVEKRKECILQITKLVFNKKFNFLYINTESQRVFKNWDELIWKEDDTWKKFDK
jgi:DNA polymerase III delta prime subunit